MPENEKLSSPSRSIYTRKYPEGDTGEQVLNALCAKVGKVITEIVCYLPKTPNRHSQSMAMSLLSMSDECSLLLHGEHAKDDDMWSKQLKKHWDEYWDSPRA